MILDCPHSPADNLEFAIKERNEKSSKMERPIIQLGCDFSDRFKEMLSREYVVVPPAEAGLLEEPGLKTGPVRALVTKAGAKGNQSIIDASPTIGLVAFFGTGFEGIDLARASERKITVTHSPGANAASVADFAMGLILASRRQILAADSLVRKGNWAGNSVVSMPAVAGIGSSRIGIFGLGAIGSLVAARAVAFGAEIGYCGRTQKVGNTYRYFEGLQSLADWADILVVAARADAGNRHIVDNHILACLGSQGHVINIARGSLIDQIALCDALERNVIAGAALDVFENEPYLPERLLSAPNLIVSPHIACATLEARIAQEDMVMSNIAAFFAGNAVPNPVRS
ncbi:2-hydroxyacid dehydrogenase [Ochrobactrum sp. BTU1]|nr:2-hydroxyacid dehydrogenase [Ochrobactrum sp. BTU1]